MNSVAKRSKQETQINQDQSRHSDAQLMQKFGFKSADLKESLTVFLEKKFQPMTKKYENLCQLVAKQENEVRERVSELEKRFEGKKTDKGVEELDATLVAICNAQAKAKMECDLRWHT